MYLKKGGKKMVPFVCFVGPNGVGKTTIIEKLVVNLKQRGYKVGVLKHAAKGFSLDKEGKDSWRYTQIGTDTVILASEEKIVLIKNLKDSIIEEAYRLLNDVDIVLIEGLKTSKFPKIEVHRKGYKLFCAKGVIALVTDEPLEFNIPQFNLEDIKAITDFIEEIFLKKSKKEDIRLLVNGVSIPLNPFLRKFFSQVIKAMVIPLKGVEESKLKNISLDIFYRK